MKMEKRSKMRKMKRANEDMMKKKKRKNYLRRIFILLETT